MLAVAHKDTDRQGYLVKIMVVNCWTLIDRIRSARSTMETITIISSRGRHHDNYNYMFSSSIVSYYSCTSLISRCENILVPSNLGKSHTHTHTHTHSHINAAVNSVFVFINSIIIIIRRTMSEGSSLPRRYSRSPSPSSSSRCACFCFILL